MKKEKILVINPYLHIGGVERALISLLYALPREKYDIYLMLVKVEGEFIKYIPSDIKVIPCPIKSELQNLDGISSKSLINLYLKDKKYSSMVRYLVGIGMLKVFGSERIYSECIFDICADEFDYVFNFSGPDLLTSIISERIIKSRKKYIWVHNEFKRGKGLPKNRVDRYRRYNAIFAVSQKCLDEIVEFIPDMARRSFLLYNITDENFYYSLASERQTAFLDNYSGVRILSVGRVNYQKGFDLIPTISERLRKKGYDFRWYIVGDGEDSAKVKEEITKLEVEENVILLGKMTNPYPFFRDCDIYIQPSRYEGYCLTIAEAKAFHKPIITTDFAGAYDQLKNGINGMIVPCNVDSLVQAADELLGNKEIQQQFSEQLSREIINTSSEVQRLIGYLEDT